MSRRKNEGKMKEKSQDMGFCQNLLWGPGQRDLGAGLG
jgi:hypothetical protein